MKASKGLLYFTVPVMLAGFAYVNLFIILIGLFGASLWLIIYQLEMIREAIKEGK
jgi:hypothetical protein